MLEFHFIKIDERTKKLRFKNTKSTFLLIALIRNSQSLMSLYKNDQHNILKFMLKYV